MRLMLWQLGLVVSFCFTPISWGSTPGTCRVQDWISVSEFQGKITRISDGDTVKVRYLGRDYTIRLLSVDTPEVSYQGRSQGQWANQASQAMKQLLPLGTTVRVVFDSERCDGYGRVLGHLFKGKLHVNQWLVKQGYAVNYCIYPNIEYCEDLGDFAQENLENENGFFSDHSVEIPYEWRRQVSGRPYSKYVGSIKNYRVLEPERVSEIPLGERVFFMRFQDIQPPFIWSGSEVQ